MVASSAVQVPSGYTGSTSRPVAAGAGRAFRWTGLYGLSRYVEAVSDGAVGEKDAGVIRGAEEPVVAWVAGGADL